MDTLSIVNRPCAQGCGQERVLGVETRTISDTRRPIIVDRRLTTITVLQGCATCVGAIVRLR
jgi:hypothetical protein